jgi:hypothetical protein
MWQRLPLHEIEIGGQMEEAEVKRQVSTALTWLCTATASRAWPGCPSDVSYMLLVACMHQGSSHLKEQ